LNASTRGASRCTNCCTAAAAAPRLAPLVDAFKLLIRQAHNTLTQLFLQLKFPESCKLGFKLMVAISWWQI
jgi:hypothetical protein